MLVSWLVVHHHMGGIACPWADIEQWPRPDAGPLHWPGIDHGEVLMAYLRCRWDMTMRRVAQRWGSEQDPYMGGGHEPGAYIYICICNAMHTLQVLKPSEENWRRPYWKPPPPPSPCIMTGTKDSKNHKTVERCKAKSVCQQGTTNDTTQKTDLTNCHGSQ